MSRPPWPVRVGIGPGMSVGDPLSSQLRDARGVVVLGDNLAGLAWFASALGPVFTLAYLDPPYNTGRRLAYADRLPGTVWRSSVQARLGAVGALLTPEGSIWAQIDDREEANLRAALDEAFGADAFVNAVRWVYGGSARGAKAHGRRLARNHDTLLVYARDPKRFRMRRATVAVHHDEDEARARGFQKDDRGWFKTAPRGDYTDASILRLRAEGRIHDTRAGGVRIRYPLRVVDGQVVEDTVVGDVWTDIPDMMHAPRAERLGFETQKPVSLLSRVLELGSDPMSWILDPYGGTGTTAVAALRANRADGGDRRFAVLESGAHGDAILLPRLEAERGGDARPILVVRLAT